MEGGKVEEGKKEVGRRRRHTLVQYWYVDMKASVRLKY